jgi:hypothetical protein
MQISVASIETRGGICTCLQWPFRLFFLGDDLYDKGSNLEYRTSHAVLDVSLKIEPRLCVNLVVIYWDHSAASKCHKCYNFEGTVYSSGHFWSMRYEYKTVSVMAITLDLFWLSILELCHNLLYYNWCSQYIVLRQTVYIWIPDWLTPFLLLFVFRTLMLDQTCYWILV